MTRAGWVLTATVAAALAWAGGWSASALWDARRAAVDAAADTAECRRLAGRITALRQSSSATSRPTADLGRTLERALSAAGVEPEAVARVAPQPVRRGGDGPPRRSTQVSLRGVTLRQSLSVVAALTGPSTGLTLEAFRLSTPPPEEGAAAADEWDVELSVSQPAP